MIRDFLYSEALKFGTDWPLGILREYARLLTAEPDSTKLTELQQWLSAVIKIGVAHTPGDWTDYEKI